VASSRQVPGSTASGHVAALDDVQAAVMWELLVLLTGEK
jgi:hypothetical protein